jgi:hypothetical protein
MLSGSSNSADAPEEALLGIELEFRNALTWEALSTMTEKWDEATWYEHTHMVWLRSGTITDTSKLCCLASRANAGLY